MPRRRYTPEQIISKLREAEVLPAMQGEAAKVMDELVTPIELELRRDENLTNKLHQFAPETANLPDKQAQKYGKQEGCL